MDPITSFILNRTLLEDKKEAKKIRKKSPKYWLSVEKRLYRRSFVGLYLVYVHLEAIDNLLDELYEGICESHIGGRSLAHRAMTQEYWWPNMQRNTLEFVKKYDQCQRMLFLSDFSFSALCLIDAFLLNDIFLF